MTTEYSLVTKRYFVVETVRSTNALHDDILAEWRKDYEAELRDGRFFIMKRRVGEWEMVK